MTGFFLISRAKQKAHGADFRRLIITTLQFDNLDTFVT